MMQPHAESIAAAGLSRRLSGLAGTNECRACLGASLGSDVGSIAAAGASDFLTSNNDIDKLYEPIFGILDRLTYAIPSPFDLFAKFGLSFAKSGADATRTALKTATRATARYTQVGVSDKVLSHIAKSAPLTFWKWAARDKMAQNASNDTLFKLALDGYNAVASQDNKLTLSIRTRLANELEGLIKSKGGTPQQAAMAAWKVAQNMGADANTLMQFAKRAGAQSADELMNPELAWNRLYGKQAAQKSGGGAGDEEGEGGGAALPLLAAGALAFFALR